MNSRKRNLIMAGVGTAAALAIATPLMTPSSVATTPALDVTEISFQLDGAQEVPPADPNGVGQAFVFNDANSPDTLCYALFVDGIRPATVAHIHPGAVGVNGAPVVDLRAPTDGNSAACTRTRERLVTRILNNPQNFYINVHNRRFPNGAIRGQLG
jgi:CHRD domain